MRVAGFDWDEGNWPKCGKHGLSKAEIEAVFANAPRVHADPKHSAHEQRLRAIGLTLESKYAFVVFTIRRRGGKRYIRPISARYMHNREVEHYERQIQDSKT